MQHLINPCRGETRPFFISFLHERERSLAADPPARVMSRIQSRRTPTLRDPSGFAVRRPFARRSSPARRQATGRSATIHSVRAPRVVRVEHCPHCESEFANEEEVHQHIAQVHARVWTGPSTFSAAGDEGAVGAVPPTTADHVATDGNRAHAEDSAGKGRDAESDDAMAAGAKRAKDLADNPPQDHGTR